MGSERAWKAVGIDFYRDWRRREIPEHKAVVLVKIVVGEKGVDGIIVARRLKAISRNASKQLKGEVCRPHDVLIIEQPRVLRHAVPPTRHKRSATRRGVGRKLRAVHVIVANVVETGVIQA